MFCSVLFSKKLVLVFVSVVMINLLASVSDMKKSKQTVNRQV